MNIVLLKILGIVGGFCFAFAAIPTMMSTVKQKRSIGTPISLAWAVFSGTVLVFSYLFFSYGFDLVISFNYAVEAISWSVIIFYHYFPKQQAI